MLDSYTKLLLQGNRTVGPSSAIIDEMGKAVTKYGDVQISTSTKKFGAGSIAFDGSGDYLTIADSTDWFFDTGDFTIDFWINFTALPTLGNTVMLITQTNGVNTSWTVQITNDGGVYKWDWYIYESGYTFHYIVSDHSSPSALTTGQWYHVAVTKNSNDYRIFRDGTQCGTTATDSNDVPNISAPLYIGYPGYELNGYMDEVRISKGIARWTSNFTPPTEEYYTNLLTNITWTDLVNVTATGNDLEKTSGINYAFDAGAFSVQGFEGDGCFEFTINETNTDRVFGLSTDNSSVGYNTIDFGIYPTNYSNISQSGAIIGPFGSSLVSGDVFCIQRIGTTIYYKRNGVTFYTSAISSSGKLYADTSFYQVNTKLINGQITWPTIDDTLSLSDSWEIGNPFSGGYNYKRLITIDYTKFPSSQIDFPVLVKLTGVNFDFTKILSSGLDVRFTTKNGVILDYYREFYSATEAYFWVKVPIISSSVNTEFYIYYGKTSDSDESNATNTFSDISKYFFDEDAANTTVSDVLGINNATANTNTDNLQVTGQIYNAFNINSTNSVTLGDVLDFGINSFTISLWIKTSSIPSEKVLIAKRAWSLADEDGYAIALTSATNLRVHYYSDANHTIPNIANNNWHKLDIIFDYTNNRSYVYVDGTISSSSPIAHTPDNQSNNSTLFIGKSAVGLNWPGSIDHVSFYQGIYTANFISSNYQNELGNILFVGSEQSGSNDLSLNIDESIIFLDSWVFQLKPDSQVFSDILSLADSWELLTNPEQQILSDSISLSDSWQFQIDPDFQNTLDTLSLSDGWDLQLSQISQDVTDSVILSDNWLIDRKGRFDTKFLTKLYMILPVAKKYATDLRTIYGTSLKYATKLYLQYSNKVIYKTDLRVTTPTPISIGTLEDFVVKLDGVTLADVDYNTLMINLTLNTTPSTATFTLARRHDDLDYMLNGTLSTITAENKIEVFDGTRKLFTGYISEIDADSQNDVVHVTASDCRLKMSRASYRIEYGGAWRMDADHNGIADDDILENTNNIPWNAPDYLRFEKNIGQAFTEVIAEASGIISGYDSLPFSGTYVPEFVTSENNLTSLIDELIRQTANCNWYIDENERLKFQTVGTGEIKTLNLASLNSRRGPYDLIIDDVRLNIKSSSYAKSITVKLGKNINQVWRRQTFSGNLNEDYTDFLTSLKDKTTFVFHQTGEHVYPRLDKEGTGNGGYPGGAFYTGMNGTTIFYFSYGVYLSYPTVVVQWVDIHSPLNTHLNLPDIFVGSGSPTKTLYLTSYGVKTGNVKWGEEVKIGSNPNGGISSTTNDYNYLVYFQDESYDRRAFATDLANFELSQNNKLETSANLSILLDAYEYYNLSFSNLINLSNTLRTGIYNNNNGFPLNIENIKIDCSKRTVNLGLTNYGKSYYVKTGNIMTGYTPASTHYAARKMIWQIIDADGHLHSTG